MNRLGMHVGATYLELKPNYIANLTAYELKCKRRRAFKQLLISIALVVCVICSNFYLHLWKERELAEAINNDYDAYIRGEKVEIASEDDIKKMDAYVYRIEHDNKCIYLRYND